MNRFQSHTPILKTARRLLAAVLVLLAIPACARPPAGARAETASMAAERGADGGTLTQETVAALLAAPLAREDAVRVALVNNPGLRATFEEIGIAEADLHQAGILPNPTLFASARSPRYASGTTNYEFELTQNMLDILVLPLRRKVEAARLEQVKLRVANAVVDTAAQTRAAVIALQSRQETLEMLRRAADATAAAAELARRQREAGNLSLLAASQYAAMHGEAVLAVADAETDVVAHREALNRLLGLWGEQTSWQLVGGLDPLPAAEAPLDHLESRAVAQRLDLAAARAEADAVARATTLTRRWRWLGGLSFGFNSEREIDGEYMRGPNFDVELPLFDRKQARLAALNSEATQTDQHLRSLAIDIRSEVREARAALFTARERALYYERAVLPLHDTMVAQMQLFQNGMLKSTYELLQVRREQIDAARQAIEAREVYWQARVALERAIGGSLEASSPQAGPKTSPAVTETAPNPSTPHEHHGGA